MICLAGVPSDGRGLDVLAMMMRLAGVLSAGLLGLDVLSRLQWCSLAQQRDQSDPSKTLT